eukprot:314175_1
MGNRVGRHKKSKHERIRSKSVTQGGARSSNYRRKRSITRRMSSKSTPERLGVERKRYSDSQSVSLSSRLQQERQSLSQVSDFSISSNVFSKDDTCGFELKPIELCSTYNRLVAIEGLREYFIEQNIVPFYRSGCITRNYPKYLQISEPSWLWPFDCIEFSQKFRYISITCWVDSWLEQQEVSSTSLPRSSPRLFAVFVQMYLSCIRRLSSFLRDGIHIFSVFCRQSPPACPDKSP